MANTDVVWVRAGKYQSPAVDEHKRRALRLYALMIAYTASTDYQTPANLAILFSTARGLFAAVPSLNTTCSPQELAIWFVYSGQSGGAYLSQSDASVNAQLLACAAWLNQTDRALDEAFLYLLGKNLAALT